VAGVVLYDWAHPQQQQFAQLSKILRKRADIDRRFREYHTRFHMELALQRRQIRDEIEKALNGACISNFRLS